MVILLVINEFGWRLDSNEKADWREKKGWMKDQWMDGECEGQGRSDQPGLACSFSSRSSLCGSRTTVTAACQTVAALALRSIHLSLKAVFK